MNSAEIPSSPSAAPLSYEQAGVAYDLIDPLKVAAQRAAGSTAGARLVEQCSRRRPVEAEVAVRGARPTVALLTAVDEEASAGGAVLGKLGPVTEGLFAWIVGLGVLVGISVWLGSKAA